VSSPRQTRDRGRREAPDERAQASPPASAPVRAPQVDELETLVLCAAEGSLVAAAARLGISRPAVAKRIRNLEALAGRALLDRGARGVRLTAAGARLLVGARRLLEERDVLMSLMSEIRGGEVASPIAGLRELLGHSRSSSRAAQQPEAQLAETERMLELVFRASSTGVIISNPDTAVVYEVNEAFCRFTGRSRAELLSLPATDTGVCYDTTDRDRLIEEVRRSGAAERTTVRARWPDGSVRLGQASARFISLGGTRQLLATVDDVTREHLLDAERTASVKAYRAVAQLAVLLLGGQPVLESIGSVLPQLRRSGEFATALLWDLDRGLAVVVDGERPPNGLERQLARVRPLHGEGVVRLAPSDSTSGLTGWEAPLPGTGHSVILLAAEPQPPPMQTLFTGVLGDLARLLQRTGPSAGS
jgi:PAS domain S-box-containing protein